MELSIVMPCLNEEKTISSCIQKSKSFLDENNIEGEVIVADNGSTDGSVNLAISLGAKIVNVNKKGYGSAIIGGVKKSKGKYVIIGDADNTYDFSNLRMFIDNLRSGDDLVMGNRFLGGIKEGAMPFKNKYIGNPILSFIGRLFYKTNIRDFHCGLRGFSRKSFDLMNLTTTGMEFASEMVVKASLLGLKTCEVPIILYPDNRDRNPHLRPWRDGWRHLKFLFIFSPKWLFMYPGIISIIFGLISIIILMTTKIQLFGVNTHYILMLYNSALILIGIQFFSFYIFSSVNAKNNYAYIGDKLFEKITNGFTFERGILFGSILIVLGFILTLNAYLNWKKYLYIKYVIFESLILVIPSVLSITAGIQIIIISLLLYILKIR